MGNGPPPHSFGGVPPEAGGIPRTTRDEEGASRLSIDLNADIGESFGVYNIGHDDLLLRSITSGKHRLRISCRRSIRDAPNRPARRARRRMPSVRIPGFPDLVGFGRREMHMEPREIADLVLYQVGAMSAIAKAEGATFST